MADVKKVRIAYDGPALKSGEMDVRDLAPALMAFANLVDNVNSIVCNNKKIKVMLNQNSIQMGSFDVTMVLDQGILEQAKVLVGLSKECGLSDLIEVLGWGASVSNGIFFLLNLIKGRKVISTETLGSGKAKITLVDGTIIEVDENTLKVFLDHTARRNIEKTVKPLKSDGIDSFELRNPIEPNDKKPVVSIKKENVQFMKAPLPEVISEEMLPEQEKTFKIIAPVFIEDNKWRLADGMSNIWAQIEDEQFLDDVKSAKISFANGDMFRAKYQVRQSINSNNDISSELIITKVIKIEKPLQQSTLDFKE